MAMVRKILGVFVLTGALAGGAGVAQFMHEETSQIARHRVALNNTSPSHGIDREAIVSAIPKQTPKNDEPANLGWNEGSGIMNSLNTIRTHGEVSEHDKKGQADLHKAISANPGIQTAVNKARRSFARFLELMDKKKNGRFYLRYPAVENNEIDNLWMEIDSFENNRFFGEVISQPLAVKNVKLGDRVEVTIGQIEDWMVRSDGLIFGAYTTRYLLKDAPQAHAEDMGPRFRD